MDALDEQIVHLMWKNARQTSDMIARQINVSSATVRRRLKQLYDANELIVEAYINPDKVGPRVVALVGINIDHEKWDEVISKINDLPEVPWLSTTTGRFNAFAMVHSNTNENLYLYLKNVLCKITGIKDAETFLILHADKRT